MRFNWLMLIPVAVLGVVLGSAAMQLGRNVDARQSGVATDELPSTREGRTAPDLTLTPLGDLPLLRRSDLARGEPVIVNFFASWCPPCRTEHPVLTALAEAGTPLYGVNYRDPNDGGLRFLAELGNPYDRIGADEPARMGPEWGVIAMPETFFIDGEGTVVLHFRGPVTRRAVETRIAPALAEAGIALPLPMDWADS